MEILCVLGKFPAAGFGDPDAVNKKGGLYPVALHALAQAGYRVTVAVIHTVDPDRERQFAESLGCAYLPPADGVRPTDVRAREITQRLAFSSVTMPHWSLGTRLRKAFKYRRKNRERIRQSLRVFGEVERALAGGAQFDHVLALTGFGDAGLLADALTDLTACPFTVWEHQTHYARRKLSPGRIETTRAAALRAHRVCAVSPQLRESVATTLGHDIRLDTIPNPIGNDFFVPPSAELRSSIDQLRGDRFLYGAWTAWRDFKRLDIALEAFAKVVATGRNAHFVVAGKPPDSAYTLADRLGIRDRVDFLGNIGRERVKALAYTCDCVIVPSDLETFGLPVIESMAAGCPVVATRCGGPESIIVDDRLGFIVECGDTEALGERMRAVMDRSEQYDETFIRDWCRQHYGESIFAQRWRTVLESPVHAG